MSFKNYEYTRPNTEELQEKFTVALEQFENVKTIEEQKQVIGVINEIRNDFGTMGNICYIRHSVDTTDPFYKEEQDFFDEYSPIVQGYVTKYYKVLMNSPFRDELEAYYGKQLFALAECNSKTYSDEVVKDLQLENKLSSQYTQLLAAAKIDFEGEERTLSQLGPFMQHTDRDMRKRASEAYYGFLEEHEEELDSIYDELVKVRTKIAKTLGFKNFVELGYARMYRTDYNAEMVANYRKQVLDYIVPVATELRKRQQARIGVEKLAYYDENFEYATGNPTPKGDAEWIINHGKTMYKELSKETDEFFNFMLDNELLDLVAKKGKAGGGYCTYIENYKAPFIFSNFNGTSGDIDVLTHEAGHAFQVYESRKFEIPEYNWPTYEACEIHSMSMEFFTWPWMKLFFEEDTDKYYFSHLSSALLFLPYGVSVDEYQHYVYENPEASPEDRKAAWRNIERKYLPHRDYEDNDYLERGGFWQRQGHIYSSPFYYIDYTLAQICALQFWKRARDNRQEAWEDYVNLCQKGGSQSFLQLVEIANLTSPFTDGCVQGVITEIQTWLHAVDDTKL
ncbi:M3 family oligoendopeptidase [Bacillus pseudomycoides]|uniref:M3 family oligoendopeptidase n=1 Tax=Bacillus pseudomycoides TaxID=64104 RepID=A0AAJ1YVX1_9BACI|nr:M3 family oligoendopeptidase [Bacillus pseudomycoides]MDR4324845.1 M3 family oligoendopeptidase [Bacillus pseudomycoides]MED1535055.1 M3 family oligoendopeptidase [Bacillus pseudomycoides]MED4650616.1 M3 family oligoendopeptidase [Bacillus pseudomycoides]PEE06283.1 oligoendopeptidase F [Bacillus pseudomycoides]PEM76959.1 oligoendopeptidase F [Bacillus pseudomycoides]